MRKRGSIFVMDFIVAISLLFAFFIYIKPYMAPTTSAAPILRNYAEQSVAYLRGLPVSSVDDSIIDLITVQYLCTDCLMSEQIAILMLNDKDSAEMVVNMTLKDFVPYRFGFSVALMSKSYEDEIILRQGELGNDLMAHSTLVSRLGKDEEIGDLYLLQIRVWN